MDKNIYETYEFLPSNSHESETDQFFVVQNDGTLLINRQVQYVTQVEDVKGVLENAQPCAVYDVSSQQYFVDVDNSTELITVSDQYVLPENSGNVYENNFLLQSIPDASTVQMSEDMAVSDLVPAHSELKNEQTDEATTAQPPDTSNLTEITITDDQYHMLEQKGWVMLNVNEKVFLLNALGLHDITGNDKLIQQLKNDIQIFMDLQAAPMESTPVLDEIPIVPLKAKENGFITPNDNVPMKPASQEHVSGNKDNIQEPHNKHEQTTQPTLETVKNENDKSSDTKKLKRNSTVIRLKTNYSVKDIPDRIVLGKTKNGKRLVAKIVDVVPPTASPCSNNMAPDHDQSKPPPDDSSVERLVELALRGGGAACAAGDVRAAEAVVRRLRRACRQPSANRDLVVTTIVRQMDASDNILHESAPTLVPGRAAQLDAAADDWNFIYIPHLLQRLTSDDTQDIDIYSPSESNKLKDDYVLHIHVVECRYENAPSKTSISLTKRRLPSFLTSRPCITVKKGEAVHACTACAKLFHNESELKLHIAAQCTVDTEEEKQPLIIDTGTDTTPTTKNCKGYQTCPHCNAQVKHANYKRHLISHFGSTDSDEKNTSTEAKNVKKKPIYKCKMCPTTYLHSSTLSKHIMAQHIKSNVLLVAD